MKIDAHLDLEKLKQLELLVADLYLFFATQFPPDREFWLELHYEEISHAGIIDGREKRPFVPYENCAEEFRIDIQAIDMIIQRVVNLQQEYNTSPPTRVEAFLTAIQIEQAAGEFHFENTVAPSACHARQSLYQVLGREDHSHAHRIAQRMKRFAAIESAASAAAEVSEQRRSFRGYDYICRDESGC